MKKLIAKILGTSANPPASAPNSRPIRDSRDNPATIMEGSDNAIRRQLIQMLLRDAMRLHGIPTTLIELQMLVVNSQSRGPGMYVRLVMPHWDERLMNYAFAFQTSLFEDIIRFEPRASTWLHGISWQFSFEDSCPYKTLPDRSFWMLPTATAQSTQAASPASPIGTASSLVPLMPLEVADLPNNDFATTVTLNDDEESDESTAPVDALKAGKSTNLPVQT